MKRITITRWVSSMVLMLGGCTPTGVTVPEGYENLEPCKVGKKITVGELTTAPELRNCDPEGVIVVFPDGTEMTAQTVGAGSGQESTSPSEYYTLTNWGVPGIAAAVVDDGSLQIWGSETAIKLQVEAITQSSSLRG